MARRQLPVIIDDSRLDTYLKILRHPPHSSLTLDWHKTKQISPAGHAILACMLDSSVEQKISLRSTNLPKSLLKYPAVSALQKKSPSTELPEPSEQNYQEKNLLVRGIPGHVDVMFLEILQEKFRPLIGEKLLFSAQLILSELIQNSADHSTGERYYLYAGIWKDEFHCGCVDMGVGIPAKLAQIYKEENDLNYLRLALKKGSTTRRQRRGGLGLYYFFEKIKTHGGKLTLLSRGAQIRKYFESRRSQETALRYPLRGTWAFARFPLPKSPKRS